MSTAAGSHRPRRRRDTVPRRLWAMLAALMVVVVAVGAAGVLVILSVTHDIEELGRDYGPAADANATALEHMLDAETGLRGYVLTGERSFLAPYNDGRPLVLPAVDALTAHLHAAGAYRLDRMVADERTAAVAWLNYARPVAVSAHPQTTGAWEQGGKNMMDAFRATNQRVEVALDGVRNGLRVDAIRLGSVAVPAIVTVILVELLVAAVLGVRLARWLARPLTAVWDTVRAIDAGDLSARADVRSGPVEVRAVARAVNELGLRVEQTAEEQRTADELRAGARRARVALRIESDPATLVQRFVEQIGPAYRADAVWVQTVERAAVSSDRAGWPMGDAWGPAAAAVDDALVAAAAEVIWTRGVARSDDRSWASADPEDALARLLAPTLTAGSLQSWMVAAVAASDGPMGLLVVASRDVRTWTDVEQQMLTGFAADLGHAIVQHNVIAAQQLAMTQMRAAEASKSAFIATVSHELRTPLTSIAGYLEMLVDGDFGELPAGVGEPIGVMVRNTNRLSSLVEDVLTQSRIDAGELRLTATRCGVTDLVGSVLDTMTPIAATADVTLEADLDRAGELEVDGDRRQLEQVLSNVLSNAVKFTRPGGDVMVVVEPAQCPGTGRRMAVIHVSDTGIGIPAADQPLLFGRFFRAQNAVDESVQGTGLGLSIVREIVELHDGTVGIESVEGEGTTVTLRLPVVAHV